MATDPAGEESLLDETSANGSFTFLSGEAAQAHVEQQQQQQEAGDTLGDVAEVDAMLKSEDGDVNGDDDDDTEVEDNISETLDQLGESWLGWLPKWQWKLELQYWRHLK